ncbi:hypothetical protein P692DRAFT_201731284 [Suillus brevipes Sb2]|nr:hypothetical protein P692DRAFT_201731284 [Suillus brevipes Sb2]
MSWDLVYRVHWLHTKCCVHDRWAEEWLLAGHEMRWAEELLLVGHEMRWTIDFLAHKAQTWLDRAQQNIEPGRDGHRCYAIRQAQTYRLLAEDARARFIQVNHAFGHDV